MVEVSVSCFTRKIKEKENSSFIPGFEVSLI